MGLGWTVALLLASACAAGCVSQRDFRKHVEEFERHAEAQEQAVRQMRSELANLDAKIEGLDARLAGIPEDIRQIRQDFVDNLTLQRDALIEQADKIQGLLDAVERRARTR